MKGDLSKLAQGISLSSQQTAANTAFVSNPETCVMQAAPGPTPGTTALDVAQFIQSACGYFELSVDGTNSTITADVIWGLGGCIEAGNGTINKQLYRYQTNAFGVDVETWTDAFTEVGTPNASMGSSDYLNHCVFDNQPIIIGAIQFTPASNDTAVATLKNRSWRTQSLGVAGNFSNCKVDIAADRCSPCFNSDDNIIQWGLTTAISGTTPLSILLPDGIAGTFRFCTKSKGITYDFIEC